MEELPLYQLFAFEEEGDLISLIGIRFNKEEHVDTFTVELLLKTLNDFYLLNSEEKLAEILELRDVLTEEERLIEYIDIIDSNLAIKLGYLLSEDSEIKELMGYLEAVPSIELPFDIDSVMEMISIKYPDEKKVFSSLYIRRIQTEKFEDTGLKVDNDIYKSAFIKLLWPEVIIPEENMEDINKVLTTLLSNKEDIETS